MYFGRFHAAEADRARAPRPYSEHVLDRAELRHVERKLATASRSMSATSIGTSSKQEWAPSTEFRSKER
jgi:hypothetical protein